jgi:signal transduction histidine kinase
MASRRVVEPPSQREDEARQGPDGLPPARAPVAWRSAEDIRAQLLRQYALPTLAVLFATFVRATLAPVLESAAPLFIYVLAVTASAYVGGFPAGLFATALGGVLGTYLFIEPQFAFGPLSPANMVLLILFLTTGGVVSWFVERMHQHHRLAQVNERLAYEAVQHGIHTLGVVSHELRNPLMAIHAALAASAAAGGALDARARAVIERQAEYLTHLVNDLVDAVRIERGGIVITPVPVPLADVVEGAIELAQPAVVEREQVLRVASLSERVVVQGDPVRLRQVLSNVLLNASKYTPRGGTIDVSATVDAGFVVVQVRDSGVGLSPEHAAKIFEPYFSVAQDRRGLGLGLFIAKHLVERHGGRIDVASEGPGRGTTFAIQLPMQSAA